MKRLGSILVVLRMGNVDLEEGNNAPMARGGDLQNVSHIRQVDGEQDQYVEPIPTGFIDPAGKPVAMMMGVPRGGGMPAYSPMGGMGNAPVRPGRSPRRGPRNGPDLAATLAGAADRG